MNIGQFPSAKTRQYRVTQTRRLLNKLMYTEEPTCLSSSMKKKSFDENQKIGRRNGMWFCTDPKEVTVFTSYCPESYATPLPFIQSPVVNVTAYIEVLHLLLKPRYQREVSLF